MRLCPMFAPRRLLAVLALGLALTACSAQDAPDPKPNLLGEYFRSGAVKNDRIRTAGSGDDRIAHLASRYDVEQFKSLMLSAFPCDTDGDEHEGEFFDTSCDLTADVEAATSGEVYGRVILVKREDGSLELLTVFVSGGKLIDSTGETYGSLDEFRSGNDLLSTKDVILSPRDLLQVEGGGEIVVVYGSTDNNALVVWLVSGGAVVVVLGAWLVLVFRRRAERAAEHQATTTESTLD